MHSYEITAHYATWTGHMASCRRIVRANGHSEAMDIFTNRIRGWKRYMGKLSMDCIQLKGRDNDA
jgi:hypothetical protein